MRTFIVRLVQDADGAGPGSAGRPRLRGVVDEVATGLRTTFRDDEELVAALSAALGARQPERDRPPDRVESFPGEDQHVAK